MRRTHDGKLWVRKIIRTYELLNTNDHALESTILRDILPRNRRIIQMINSAYQDDKQHDPYLVLWFEYCRGGALQHALSQCPSITEGFIWHCFIQIAEGLDHIHNSASRTVIHRDIKPDNILLMENLHSSAPWPNVKIGDFGVATLEKNSQIRCISSWQGPEMPLCSKAGDIWGLGAIIHWLAHGYPPVKPRPASFKGTQSEWTRRPESKQPTILPKSFSTKLNNHMMTCLRWYRSDRVSSHQLVTNLKRDRVC